jgi:methylase of polypeptide subunit release factors
VTVDPEAPGVGRLKAVFDAHGYTGPDAVAALGEKLGGSALRMDAPAYATRLAASTPLHVLLRLFGLLAPAREDEAREALVPVALDDVVAMGLVERCAEGVRARFALSAHEGLLLAHDRREEGPIGRDHVLGVNPTSTTLARLTVRRSEATALDLGCGCGVQALLAARHARHVTGVDLNPHAIELARFNARLNAVENVEWLEGDLFAPVEGRRFDLVVSNPPYVISPESSYTFRDGGRPRDGFCAEVVRRCADHLADGGFATVLCNWALAEGEDRGLPPRRWVEGAGCDAWVIDRGAQDPLTYAALWNRRRDAAAYRDALDRWLAYYRAEGIARIGLGAVVLRRRASGATWARVDEVPEAPQDGCGAQILRIFAAQDFLLDHRDDEALLGARLEMADDLRVVQTLAPVRGDFVLEDARVRLGAGLRLEGRIDPHAFHLLRACDGRRPLGVAVEDLGRGRTVDRASVVEVARRLVALGFLVPASSPGEGPQRRT